MTKTASFVLLNMREDFFGYMQGDITFQKSCIGGSKLRHQLKSEVEYDRKSAGRNQGYEAGGAGV